MTTHITITEEALDYLMSETGATDKEKAIEILMTTIEKCKVKDSLPKGIQEALNSGDGSYHP